MNEHDGEHERDAMRDQDEVRRLLAGAADPAPDLPPDVGARLDEVLAGLVSERTAQGGVHEQADRSPGSGSVTELAARRRRRWPQLLVAAAFVSVVGIGVGTVLDGSSESGDAAMETAVTAESGAAGAEGAPPDAPEAAPPDADTGAEVPQSARSLVVEKQARRLRTGSLTLDVQIIEDFGLAVPVGQTPEQFARACVRPSTGAGDEWLAVRLDGEQGVLVLRAPTGGRRTAEVFTCGEPDSPAAATEVDAR